jgi:endonuclease/exonuclease/phosphatase (EEP) superfamily protein YafD
VFRTVFVWLLILAGAGAAGCAALAAFGGPYNRWLDLLAHFIPFFAVGSLAAVVSLVFRPNRLQVGAAVLVLAVAALSCGRLMLPPYLYDDLPAPGPARPDDLKIIQFNALDGNHRFAAIKAWVAAQDADVLVIEEAPGLGEHLLALGYIPSCGGCGMGLYSKEKPVWDNGPTTDWRIARLVAAARFQDRRGDYTIMAVHRGRPTRTARVAGEIAAVKEMAGRFPADSNILAGDFNSTPWSAALQREERSLNLVRRTRALATWPAEAVSHNRFGFPFPVLPIDHVFAGRDWATVKVERGPKLGSDHYPVVVTLRRVRNLPATVRAAKR